MKCFRKRKWNTEIFYENPKIKTQNGCRSIKTAATVWNGRKNYHNGVGNDWWEWVMSEWVSDVLRYTVEFLTKHTCMFRYSLPSKKHSCANWGYKLPNLINQSLIGIYDLPGNWCVTDVAPTWRRILSCHLSLASTTWNGNKNFSPRKNLAGIPESFTDRCQLFSLPPSYHRPALPGDYFLFFLVLWPPLSGTVFSELSFDVLTQQSADCVPKNYSCDGSRSPCIRPASRSILV